MYNLGGGNSFKINSLANRAISTFFAVIFFFALGAIVDSREASGQHPNCPPGAVLRNFNFQFGPNNCQINVSYCYQCHPTTGPEIVRQHGWHHIPRSCQYNRIEAEKEVQRRIAEDLKELCDGQPQPCPQQPNMTIRRPKCYYAQNIPDEEGVYFIPCDGDNNYCIYSVGYCIQYSPPPAKLIWFEDMLARANIGSDNDCPMIEPSLLNWGIPSFMLGNPDVYDIPWTTDCFKFQEELCPPYPLPLPE